MCHVPHAVRGSALSGVAQVLGLAGLMGPLGAASHTLGNYKMYIPDDYAWPLDDRDKCVGPCRPRGRQRGPRG